MKAQWLEKDQWWPVRTPFGDMVLAGDEEALHYLFLPGHPKEEVLGQEKERRGRPASVGEAEHQLRAYFSGALAHFDLPLAPRGTPWQKEVWRALLDIPFGETRSYGDIAKAVGKPGASRAVGRANNTNPLPVIVPCHRVVGADGSLTGYGGGLDLKARLLAHEQDVLGRRGQPSEARRPALQRRAQWEAQWE
jgi:methylated-DNA-[protein]-cysteine S-methyltransferase